MELYNAAQEKVWLKISDQILQSFFIKIISEGSHVSLQ